MSDDTQVNVYVDDVLFGSFPHWAFLLVLDGIKERFPGSSILMEVE